MSNLEKFAEASFSQNYSNCQTQINALDDGRRARYNRMIGSAAKPVPRLMGDLPTSVDSVRNAGTVECDKHLYCDSNMKFPAKLTSWEAATLEREQKRPDFHAWLRNYDRKSWSLVIPYEMGGESTPMYPDFIVARKSSNGIVLDILEPHRDDATDNWPKAVGMAKYAAAHPGDFGRIMMIRMVTVAGAKTLRALDMAKLAVRNKVLPITTDAQLGAIFDSDGEVL